MKQEYDTPKAEIIATHLDAFCADSNVLSTNFDNSFAGDNKNTSTDGLDEVYEGNVNEP